MPVVIKMFCYLCHFSNKAEEQYIWHILVHICDFEFQSSIQIACFVLLLFCNVCNVSGAAVQQKGLYGWQKVHKGRGVQIVSKIHVWRTKKVAFLWNAY